MNKVEHRAVLRWAWQGGSENIYTVHGWLVVYIGIGGGSEL